MSTTSTELAGLTLAVRQLVESQREATAMVDEHWKRLHARADDFDALRERLAAAERERDEAREALREHSDVLHDLVNIINGLDIRMSRLDSDAMSATLLLAERLLEEYHEDED